MPKYVLSVQNQNKLGQMYFDTSKYESIASVNHYGSQPLQVMWKFSENKYVVEERGSKRRLEVIDKEEAQKRLNEI